VALTSSYFETTIVLPMNNLFMTINDEADDKIRTNVLLPNFRVNTKKE